MLPSQLCFFSKRGKNQCDVILIAQILLKKVLNIFVRMWEIT